MAKLPNSVLAFTADSADRKEGYTNFVEYYNLYKEGKTQNANGVSFSEMNEKMLTFFSDEVARLSGKKQSDVPDLATYCNFSDVKEAAFAVVGMLTDLIIPDALIKDLGMIAEIKNGGWGDSL